MTYLQSGGGKFLYHLKLFFVHEIRRAYRKKMGKMTSKSSTKAVRLVELLIILFVSIVPLIFNSIATNIFEYQSIAQEQYDFGFIRSIISYSTGICLLLYILSKQKRNIKDIGLRFHSKDLIVALILYITMNFNLMSYMLIRNYFWKSEHLGLKACNIEALPAKLSIWCVYPLRNFCTKKSFKW